MVEINRIIAAVQSAAPNGRRVSRGSVDTGLFQQVFNAHIFKRIRNSSTRHKDAGDLGRWEARLERVLHRPEMGTSR